MANSVDYGEGFWAEDQAEFDRETPDTDASTPAARDQDPQQQQTQYNTVKWEFQQSFFPPDLKGKTSIEFSVKNKAINAEPSFCSNRDDFEAPRCFEAADLVKRAGFKTFRVRGLSYDMPLSVELTSVQAPKRIAFGVPATASSSAASTVRFSIIPSRNKAVSEFYERAVDDVTQEHTMAHPGLDEKTIKSQVHRINALNESWIEQGSPVYSVLDSEIRNQMSVHEKNGIRFHVHAGDHAPIEEAVQRAVQLQQENVAYSHLTHPDGPSFTVSIPPTKVFNAKTGMNEMRVTTFGDLIYKDTLAKMETLKNTNDPVKIKQAQALLDNFEKTPLVSFEGELEAEYLKQPNPKAARQ